GRGGDRRSGEGREGGGENGGESGTSHRKSFHGRPYSFQRLATLSRASSDMRISSGQGRVKPSPGPLRVASIPIFEPRFGRREAWSSESTGPSVNCTSRSGSMWLSTFHTTSWGSWTSTSS